MNRPVLIAALALAGTTLLHLIAGEGDVHRPLLGASTDGEAALYISVLWHGVSLLLGLSAVALIVAARDVRRHALTIWLGAGLSLGLGGLFVGYGVLRLGSIWMAPQWILLLPVGALALWGLRRADKSAW